jgi:hypothetical protein
MTMPIAAPGSGKNGSGANVIQDGLDEIRGDLRPIIETIARSARWVHPDTFRALPLWCPDTARGRPRFDAKWSRPLVSKNGFPKVEENVRAGVALVKALGVLGDKPRNWTVCHVWGYDDPAFAKQSTIVKDPCYYSCIGNMVWLPTPLKGFTDAVPEIKAMLRACSFHLYGWACEHGDVANEATRIRSGEVPKGYPSAWPTATRRTFPPGTAPYSAAAIAATEKQKAEIRTRLADLSLTYYPHDEVREILAFWKVSLR